MGLSFCKRRGLRYSLLPSEQLVSLSRLPHLTSEGNVSLIGMRLVQRNYDSLKVAKCLVINSLLGDSGDTHIYTECVWEAINPLTHRQIAGTSFFHLIGRQSAAKSVMNSIHTGAVQRLDGDGSYQSRLKI